MDEKRSELNRPLRVVVFSGGPVLERGVKEFLRRLEDHPEIDLLACFCQSKNPSFSGVIYDLWRRRQLLAIPLLIARVLGRLADFLSRPIDEFSLKRKLNRLSERIHYVPDIHGEAVLEAVRSLSPDLGLIYGAPILKPKLFQIPTCGTLGIHHGKVPDYRGKKTTFWAVYNREKTAGVTIQKVNAGLDTCDIVKQGEVPIDRQSLRAVWNGVHKLGLELYIQALLEIKRGNATFHPQTKGNGKLYRDPTAKDILRLWLRRTEGVNRIGE